MKLPISVVMTSSVPDCRRSQPGQSAHNAPPTIPARKQAGVRHENRRAVQPGRDEGRADGADIELALARRC